MPLPRTIARRWTYAAQGVSVLALVAGVGVILAPRARVAPPSVSAAPSATGVTEKDSSDASAGVPTPDWGELAADLSKARTPLEDGAVLASAGGDASTPNSAAETAPGDADEIPAAPAPPGWQYLGYARDSDGSFAALVAVNGSQHFVRTGAELESFSVGAIEPHRLIIVREGRRFQVQRVEPLPFDPVTAEAGARTRIRDSQARGRVGQTAQRRARDIEAARQRRLQAARKAGVAPPEEPPGQ